MYRHEKEWKRKNEYKDLNLTQHEEKGRATVYRTDLGHWGSGMAATHTHHPGSGPDDV